MGATRRVVFVGISSLLLVSLLAGCGIFSSETTFVRTFPGDVCKTIPQKSLKN